MATAKVTVNNSVILDLTDATAATGSDVISPKTAYIADGSKVTGTASGGITPTGNINITQAGVTDVTNYATATVPSGTSGTPTATKGAVSNHAVTVTPSVTNSAGYIDGGTKTGTGVTVSASELVSGSETKTANGTYNVTTLASLEVAIPIVHYYTGASAPASSLGSNGDIYLQTGG